MQSEKDLEEYCTSLLDIKSQAHKKFLIDIKKKHRICKFLKILLMFVICLLILFE